MRRNIQAAHLKNFILTLAILCLAASCATQPRIPLEPAQKLSSYAFSKDAPLEDRIQKAPDFVIDFLKKVDNVKTYAAHALSAQELSMTKQYLSLLPGGFRKTLQSRLLGIYFVDNFIGGGFTEYVFGNDGETHAFIAFNAAVLNTGMSDWITARDRSAFNYTDPSSVTLASDCGSEYRALMQILLHETSHVVDAVLHYKGQAEGSLPQSYPFITQYWKQYAAPKAEYDFPKRSSIAFYGLGGGPKIPSMEILETYTELSKTPFASLYGSQTVLEDFAECFTWSYYTQVLHQKYTVTVFKAGKPALTFDPLANPVVAERIKSISELFK